LVKKGLEMIKKRIKELKVELSGLKDELRAWEKYNKIENDFLRTEIKSKKNLINKYLKLLNKKK